MMLQRAAVLGVLVITASSWAQRQVAEPNQAGGNPADVQPVERDLQPRHIFAKPAPASIKIPADPTGRLLIKFTDSSKARTSAGRVESIAARDISGAQRIIQQYGLTVAPAIQLEPQKIAAIESRAAAHSRRAQPDLGGMMYLRAPEDNLPLLREAARELITLPEIEFVEFEVNYTTAYRGGPGACCLSTTNCIQTDATGCTLAGGVYQGDGTDCSTSGICSAGTTGRCCIPADGVLTCVDGLTEQNCTAQGGQYGGNGSTCDGLPGGCPDLGACCLANDQCVALLESECIAGQFRGVGTNCLAPGICEQVGEIGRCCIPNKGMVTCIDAVDMESCDSFGGVYGGDGSDCNDISFDCPDIGACCTGASDCQPLTQAQCDPVPDSEFLGVGTNCMDEDACEEPDCGVVGTGPCLSCHDPADYPFSGGRYCDNEECCEAVCNLDPFCCEEDAEPYAPGRFGSPRWDENCVLLAYSVSECAGFPTENVCLAGPPDSCGTAHADPGCNDYQCCIAVCALEPICCEIGWDSTCAFVANASCQSSSPTQVTPSFSDAQGYLTSATYLQQFGGIPIHAVRSPIPPVSGNVKDVQLCNANETVLGYDGSGWDLHTLWQFGTYLAQQHGPGSVNRARGKGIKVGVVEHSAFADWQNPAFTHEDLRGKVIPEPGQTIIINPFDPDSDLSGNHGTACLGIIGAKDDGLKGHSFQALGYRESNGTLHVSDEIGVVGIAPDADLYFFPIVSLEQGGRLLSAIASALTVFGPGDVLSFSIGPGSDGSPLGTTLASDFGSWTMLRLATDLGVTCCIAAGNDCANVDALGQFMTQDSGAVIVGAVTPGNPYCRLGFSNYCQACNAVNRVHVSAWGSNVATLGYGSLFLGADAANASGRLVRSYTNGFNGTSAATPQIAALVACMQGFALQQFGIPLRPEDMRTLLGLNGYLQCQVELQDLFGPGGDPCLGDYDPAAPPARVGGEEVAYPIPMFLAEKVISFPLSDGAGNVNDICVLRGNRLFGNAASIRQPDNNALIVTTQFTVRGDRPNPGSCPEFASQVGAANYLGNGHVFDVLVKATNPTPGANIINVVTKVGYPGVTSIQIVDLYDWISNRWSPMGAVIMNGDPATVCSANGAGVDQCFGFTAQRANRFIRGSDNRILCRVYVIGLTGGGDGGPGGLGNGTFNGRLDWVDIQTAFGGGGFIPTGGSGGLGFSE